MDFIQYVVHCPLSEEKVNVKLPLYLIKHTAMKEYGGVEVMINVVLTSTLVGAEWSTSRPGCFNPSTHWIGGWVGPGTGLDDMKRRIFPLPGFELRPFNQQQGISNSLKPEINLNSI
jgi:hypothetical protein